jgi:hypothetical protein
VSIRVHSWFKSRLLETGDRGHCCRFGSREDAKENAGCCRGRVVEHEHEHVFVFIRGSNHVSLRLSVKIRVHPWRRKHPWHRTRGLPSAARQPNTERQTYAIPFAASRETISLQNYPSADTQQHRSWAGKPELQKFVSIRVHSWFKTTTNIPPAIIRENPCSSVAPKHPWPPVATR